MPGISPWTANHLSEKPSLFEFDDGQRLHTPAAFSYKSSVCGALHCSDAGSAIPLVAVSKKDWTLRVRSVVSAIWCICKKGESSGTMKVGGRGRAWPVPAEEARQDKPVSCCVAAGTAAVLGFEKVTYPSSPECAEGS